METREKNVVVMGGLILDQYLSIDHWPNRGQDGFIDEERTFVGGCTINMVVSFHNLMGKEDGLKVHAVSAIGNDNEARQILSYMDNHGLSNEYLFEKQGQTGKSLVFVEQDGERTFLTKKGVEGIFTKEMGETIAESKAVVAGVTGYYLLNEAHREIISCLKRLKEHGCRILFDPSPLVKEIDKNTLEDILSLADVITPNESELLILGGQQCIEEYIKKNKTIFLKNGSEGGILYDQGKITNYRAERVEALDTTGAGDSFAGAILYAMAREISMEEALDMAIKSAAETVKVMGPHSFWKSEKGE